MPSRAYSEDDSGRLLVCFALALSQAAWRGFADRREMRFRRTFKEFGKYRGRDLGADAHRNRSCQSFDAQDMQRFSYYAEDLVAAMQARPFRSRR
jgi:hypothetical protein